MKTISNYSLLVLLTTLSITSALDTDPNIRRILQSPSTPETENQLRDKIDAKIQARTAAAQEYQQILMTIKNIKASLDLVLPDLLQKRMIAENGYVFYYQTSLKCKGYFPDLDIIGVSREVPADFCQIYPLNLDTYDLVTLRAQDEGYIEDTRAAIFAVNSQTDYLADANKQQSLYQYLAGLFSLRNNTQLRDKYSSKTNSFSTFLYQQSQKLQIKKQIQAAAVQLDTQYAQIVKQKYAENQNNAINCFRNLGTIRIDALHQYDLAKALQQQVLYKKAALDTAFTNLYAKNTQIAGITAELGVLVDQYVALF